MAAQTTFFTHTCTGSPVGLTTIIGGLRKFPSVLAARAGRTNVGTLYWGAAAVSSTAAGGYLERGDAIAIDRQFVNSDQWYFVGTLNDVIHFTVIE